MQRLMWCVPVVAVVLLTACPKEQQGAAVKNPGVEQPSTAAPQPVIQLMTSMGTITIQLDRERAPETVRNFLEYARSGHYDGTVFHRVIRDFMIQGGGFTADMRQKPTRPPVKNEAANGLSNVRGSIAMARTNVVDSATSQFFINVVDNNGVGVNLDHQGPNNYGYAVFGRVTEGMDVVDRIRAVQTSSAGMHNDVPVTPVVIQKANILAE